MRQRRSLAGSAGKSVVAAGLTTALVALAIPPAQATTALEREHTTYKVTPYVISDPDLVKHPDRVIAELNKSGNLDRLGVKPATPDSPSKITRSTRPTADEPAHYIVDSARFPRGTKPEDPYQYADEPQCAEHIDQAGQDAGWIKNRYSYCQVHLIAATAFRCTFFPRPNCRVTGHFVSRNRLLGYGKIGGHEPTTITSRWADFRLHVDILGATGPFSRASAKLKTSIKCDGNYLDPNYPSHDGNACHPGQLEDTEKSIPGWRLDGGAHFDLVSQAFEPSSLHDEQLGTGVFHIDYDFSLPFPYIFEIGADGPEGGMRFDSAWYLTTNRAEQLGSVFDRAVPGLSHRIVDPNIRGVVNHLLSAQADPEHTVPRKEGKVLLGGTAKDTIRRLAGAKSADHRTRQDANRNTATYFCYNSPEMPAQPPDGGPFDCDEYPFASTYEGAARARPQYDGPAFERYYSVRWVNRDQNQEAGNRLGAWYLNDRIIDGDKFFVPVMP
jgi:hypothetical protein